MRPFSTVLLRYRPTPIVRIDTYRVARVAGHCAGTGRVGILPGENRIGVLLTLPARALSRLRWPPSVKGLAGGYVFSLLDEDMTIFDITTIIAYTYLFEVISNKTHAMIYLCYPKEKYFTCFYFMPKCRMTEHLYESRVMTRKEEMVGCYSRGSHMLKKIVSSCSRSSLMSILAQEKI